MAEKKLVLYHDEDPRYMTLLYGNAYEETIYAETQYVDENTGKVEMDTIELAVHVDDMIKMRDFLNTIISKIGPAGTYDDKGILVEAI